MNLKEYAWYFNERERIRIKKEDMGLPRPWTDDPVFQQFRFTNVHREDDRVSRDLFDAVDVDASPRQLLFNAFMFRTWNRGDTFEIAGGFQYHWHKNLAKEKLDAAYKEGHSVFGNAYLMTNSMTAGAPKHHFYLDVFDTVWEQSPRFAKELKDHPTLEHATKMFTSVPGYASFLGYELALDMEMIGLLVDPVDKYSWANPGPGARRGLNHIFGRDRNFQQPVPKFLQEMRELFYESTFFLEPHVGVRYPFDMRCIENGLCELGKYVRARETGRSKRRYTPYES